MENFQKSLDLLRKQLSETSREELEKDWKELSSQQFGNVSAKGFLSVFDHEELNDLPLSENKPNGTLTLTYNELKEIKYSLPAGSVARIANELKIKEETVRNFFGVKKHENRKAFAIQPADGGGVVQVEDSRILELAKKILEESHQRIPSQS